MILAFNNAKFYVRQPDRPTLGEKPEDHAAAE